jgi:hypothetical protein
MSAIESLYQATASEDSEECAVIILILEACNSVRLS